MHYSALCTLLSTVLRQKKRQITKKIPLSFSFDGRFLRFRRRKTSPRIPPRVLCERSYFRTACRRLFYALRSYLQNGQSLRRCVKTFTAFVFAASAHACKSRLGSLRQNSSVAVFGKSTKRRRRNAAQKRVVRRQRHARNVDILPVDRCKRRCSVYNGKTLV